MKQLLRPRFWIPGLVIVALMAWVGVSVLGVSAALREAEAAVAAGLPDATEESEAQRQRVRQLLAARGEPEYAWREVVCAVDAEGSVTMANDHTQRCKIRAVDLYPLDKTGTRGCHAMDRFRDRHQESLTNVRLYRGHDIDVGTADYSIDCDQLLGVAWYSQNKESRWLDGEAPTEPGTWVVAVHETHVSATAIGCHPLVPLFCVAPPNAPRM